ncbi:MAG: hypothetical protein WC294_08560 [Methanoregula sp.]
MQNYLFYHLVVRFTIDCPTGSMTSVLSEGTIRNDQKSYPAHG